MKIFVLHYIIGHLETFSGHFKLIHTLKFEPNVPMLGEPLHPRTINHHAFELRRQQSCFSRVLYRLHGHKWLQMCLLRMKKNHINIFLMLEFARIILLFLNLTTKTWNWDTIWAECAHQFPNQLTLLMLVKGSNQAIVVHKFFHFWNAWMNNNNSRNYSKIKNLSIKYNTNWMLMKFAMIKTQKILSEPCNLFFWEF